ncbi:MAG: SLBB domain-containing protein [Saprospiraceae bacterium]
MKTYSHFCFAFLMILSFAYPIQLSSQQKLNFENEARTELDRVGITEQELRNHLLEKGIDISNLNNLTAEEAIQMQAEIETAIKEIQVEKKNAKNKIGTPSAIDNRKIGNSTSSKTSRQEMNPLAAKAGGVTNDTSKSIEGGVIEVKDSIAIWGQHIFRNKSLALYRQANDIKPPLSYVLGVADQVTISIWGFSQLNETYEINAEGYITPDRMPRIFLKGVTLGRAKALLNNYFKKFYRFNANQFDVALNYSRTINVNIFGEVYQYGGFTIPAINTAFNALIAAGGPNNLGSVRRIKLIRNGKSSLIDVYKFMQNPGLEKDFYLENNDVIQVPVAEKVVQIEGAVKRPFKYELLESEDLNHLIAYAGGLKENAIIKTIQIERIQNDKKLILDVPYQDIFSKGGDFMLKKGDKILVFSIRTSVEEQIFVTGEVRAEASYQYKPGMKLSELLKRIEFTTESNLEFAFVKRKNPNNTFSFLRTNLESIINGNKSEDLVLKAQDEVIIYKLSVFADKSYVNVQGATRLPGKFDLNPNEDVRVKDIVLLAGGLKTDAFNYAFLFRVKSNNKNDYEIIRIGIRDIMDNQNSDQNIYIKPFDSLVILSQTSFTDLSYVEISGAVKSPGRFAYGLGMSAHDLISLANGFTYYAASNKIDIFRVVIKNNEPTKTIVRTIVFSKNLNEVDVQSDFKLDPYDIVVVRSQPEFQFQQMVTIEGEVKYPGPYALLSPNEKVTDLVQRAGGLTLEAFPQGATLYRTLDSIGFIVMDMAQALKKPNSRFNFILKESDNIFIPKQKDLVRIAGATNAKDLYPEKLFANNNIIAVPYYEGRKAKYYINQYAAGVSSSGDIRKITVEHANGKIERTRNYFFFKSYPNVYKGSVINVGYKEVKAEKLKKDRKDVDWAKVVADTIAQATAILSLILLIDRLN